MSNKCVSDIMERNIITVNCDDSINHVAHLMSMHDIGFIPVMKNGLPFGVVTDRDIVVRGVAMDTMPQTVEEVATKGIIHASPQDSLKCVGDKMAERQIRRLPVIVDDELVGIVSLGDLALERMSDQKAGDALSQISKSDRKQWMFNVLDQANATDNVSVHDYQL